MSETVEAAIFANMPNDVFLMCDSDLGNSEVFISAASGTSFMVAGEIKSIDRHRVELENCAYRILKTGNSTVN
ncbi:MAG TPA: hypothetical protein VGI63_00875 [Verrucomicrobiae bacterium]